MREICTPGSVRGATRNGRPYRDNFRGGDGNVAMGAELRPISKDIEISHRTLKRARHRPTRPSRLTPSDACSCVLTRTYPMAVLVRSACDVCVCMQSVVTDFEDRIEKNRFPIGDGVVDWV